MKIVVAKPTDAQVAEMRQCPIWEKEAGVFDWTYEEAETCYVIEGAARVRMPDGGEVAFGVGDLVTFPRGLTCIWEITRGLRKHYRFDQ